MSQLHDGKGDNVHGNKTSIYNIELGNFIPIAILVLGLGLGIYFVLQSKSKADEFKLIDVSPEDRDSIYFNIFVVRFHNTLIEKDSSSMDSIIEEQLQIFKDYEELGLYLKVHYKDSILPLRIEKDEQLKD